MISAYARVQVFNLPTTYTYAFEPDIGIIVRAIANGSGD